MLKLLAAVAFMSLALASGVADASADPPPGVVPAPAALVLLTVGAGVVAIGTWWRGRGK
jgi:hypothetical protein